MALGLLLFSLYGVWDVLSFPAEVLRWSLPLRFGLACPMLAAVLWWGRDPERRRTLRRIVLPAFLAVAVTVVGIIFAARRAGVEVGVEGVFLMTIATYSFSSLRPRPGEPAARAAS